jgi:hypothetical protein
MNINYTNMKNGILTLLGTDNRFLPGLCENLTPYLWYISEIFLK